MLTHKHIDLICIVILVLTVAATLIFMNGKAFGMTAIVDEDSESYEGDDHFTANDKNGTWTSSTTVNITLNGDDAKISGDGAYMKDGDLYIFGGGYYVLEGELTDGSIIVSANDSSKVWIMLNGVDITCSDNAAIIVDQADKVFLTLAEGTSNTVSDGSEYGEEAVAQEITAAIFTHDDLTINGCGSLVVNGNYNHGIKSKDKLVITGGDIKITSVGDAINVNDEFALMEASVTISAKDDGIHSDTSVYIESGNVLINEAYEGIEAPVIEVTGGDITVYSTDDGFNAGVKEDESVTPYISISGGNITVDIENANDSDGLDSNSDVYISGGVINITINGSGPNDPIDYGAESGGVLEITGGDVTATVNGTVMTVEEIKESNSQMMGGGMGGFGGERQGGMQPPEGFDGERPEGMQSPEGFDGERPEGMQPPDGSDGRMKRNGGFGNEGKKQEENNE